MQGGKVQLSLAQALALAIENNLDIAVQRYVRPIAEADMLRTSSGQAARGIPGALVPSGLSAGALGVGVNQAAGTGGVGAAGGISGGGGAVSVPQVGTFDPAISFSASYDHTAAPLNSTVVAGVPLVTTTSAASSANYVMSRAPRRRATTDCGCDDSIAVLAGACLPDPRNKSLRPCGVRCVFGAKRVPHHLLLRMNTKREQDRERD